MKKEIGGYIELDTYELPMLHEDAIALNCGRNALSYLIKAKGIKRIKIPYLICESVPDVCKRESVSVSYYSVCNDFMPQEKIFLHSDEWLLLVNHYGQLTDKVIQKYKNKYERVIVDNTHSYYQMPGENIDSLYSCRKYFGVPDGAFLYTDSKLDIKLSRDESYERMRFLLGRYERSASEFYDEFKSNDELFGNQPIKIMSKLTMNLLHGINYESVKATRIENFCRYDDGLGSNNLINLNCIGTYMYPYMIENGAAVRERLISKGIYIPLLWPFVLTNTDPNSDEYRMASNLLPLPIDQRYDETDINVIINTINKLT